jgi:hypothetical protein
MTKKRYVAILAVTLSVVGGPVLAGDGLGIVGSGHDRSARGGPGKAGSHYAGCEGHTLAASEKDAMTDDWIRTKTQCERNGGTWNASVPADGWHYGEICRICHAPHALGTAAPDYYLEGLLWNRPVNEDDYVMYSPRSVHGGEVGALEGDVRGATGPSKLCLSCHDGTIAIDVRYGIGSLFVSAGRSLGIKSVDGMIDLRNMHPIGVDYPAEGVVGAAYGGQFNPLDTAVGGTIDHKSGYTSNTTTVAAVSSGTIRDVLFDGKVECSSCHDVHNSEGVAVPFSQILRVPQNTLNQGGERASGLCLTCHAK